MKRHARVCHRLAAGVLWASSTAGAVLAAPVWAQHGEALTERPSGRPIEEIVVTATRREETIQDVAITVTAITAETLKDADIDTVREMTFVTPGFQGGRNFGVQHPVIRGVGSSGTSPSDEANVSIYVDGIYQGSSYGTFMDLVAVDRVEVLRGPQGTVFGRNATGGLINVITPEPSYDFYGFVRGRAGVLETDDVTEPDTDIRGYVTGRISDRIAADLAAVYRNRGDYVKNLVGDDDFGGVEVTNIRSKVLFEPVDWVQLILTAEHLNQNSQTVAAAPVAGETAGEPLGAVIPTKPYQAALDIEPKLDLDRTALALRTVFEFDGFNVETSHGYNETETHQIADSDASDIFIGVLDIGTGPNFADTESMTHEIRLLSTDGGPFADRLDWVAGLYAFDLETETNAYLATAAYDVATRNLLGVTEIRSNSKTDTTSYAAFAEGTLTLTDRWFLTLGIRYTDEEVSTEPNARVNGFPLPAPEGEGSFEKTTYRAAIRYAVSDTTNLYASYSTGFKSGVFNGSILSPTLLDPEEIEAWEAGVKSDPLPWLRTNVAAYYYDYTDLQVNARDPNSTAYVLQNAANAEIYGAEVEVTVLPTDQLSLRGSIAWNHGRYDEFETAQTFVPQPIGGAITTENDVSGNQLVRAPEWTANIGFNWQKEYRNGRLGVAGNVYYSDRVYHDFLNLKSRSQDPYYMGTAQVSWTLPGDRWQFSLWGKNLFDEDILQQMRVSDLSADGLYEPPRTIGVGVETNF